jgi:hypothetical protein
VSPRFTFLVVERGELEALASSTLDQLAGRLGWIDHRDRFSPDDRPLYAVGPVSIWRDDGFEDVPAESIPSITVRALARRNPTWAALLLGDLADHAAWPTLRLAQSGWRRWWIGGLVAELERCRARDAYEPEIHELMRLVPGYPMQIPWFDREAAARGAGARSGPILDAPGVSGIVLCELETAKLTRLLDWADTVPRFHRYLEGDTTEPDAWDAFVRRHVTLLRRVHADEIVLAKI